MANAQATQVAVETITQQTPAAQVTQVAVEVLTRITINAQVTQVAVETLVPFGSGQTPLIFAVT